MKENSPARTLALALIISSFVIFGISSLTLIARAQTPTPEPTAEIPLETPGQTAEPPTLTPEAPNLSAKKGYTIANDLNGNGRPDPGDKITYAITVENRGPLELTSLVIRDDVPENYFVSITNVDISKEGTFQDGIIEWNLPMLGAGSSESVNYTVTLKDPLGIGTIGIPNAVSILREGVVLATAESKFSVEVPTPTLTPTLTPTPTPTLTPTALLITPSPTAETGASILNDKPLSTITVGTLALIGIAVFTLIGINFRPYKGKNAEESYEISHERISIFREGVIIIFIVTAVLLMGISGVLPSDGVVSILSAIVGYVFGRASARKTPG